MLATREIGAIEKFCRRIVDLTHWNPLYKNHSKSTIIKLAKSKSVFSVKSFQRPWWTLLAYVAVGQNHLVEKLMDMPEVKFIELPTTLSYRVEIWRMVMELVEYQFMENNLMMKISIYTIMGQVGSQWQMLAKVRTLSLNSYDS